MKKGRKPRKPKDPRNASNTGGEEEVERQTQEQGQLGPPARRPPTALGAEAPPPPPQEPPRSRPAPVPERHRPVLFRFLRTLRTAVGTMLDIADAAAEAITKRLGGRA